MGSMPVQVDNHHGLLFGNLGKSKQIFMFLGGLYETGVTGFTDWRYLGHSTVDFGWGGPVTVLPLSYKLLGSMEPCFFLPYSGDAGSKDSGFKVLVNLRESAMPEFKEAMDKFHKGDEFVLT